MCVHVLQDVWYRRGFVHVPDQRRRDDLSESSLCHTVHRWTTWTHDDGDGEELTGIVKLHIQNYIGHTGVKDFSYLVFYNNLLCVLFCNISTIIIHKLVCSVQNEGVFLGFFIHHW